ncbi:hypothetical protein QOZ80_9BG0700280 [Eleusine coracana subsp. coracana]|nr:hypothetical protein QOZ80_9BG0700280 [Eleusine coracana subsp. coracana]
MGSASPDAASLPPWQDLPLDLPRDISGRLLVAADYVHFHATCKPWRDTLPPAHHRPAVLPWAMARRAARLHGPPEGTLHLLLQVETSPRRHQRGIPRWVINPDDGTVTSWLITKSACGTIDDPLTRSAAAMPVPRFPEEIKRWEDSAVGVASSDGTVIFYAYGRIHVVHLFAEGFYMALGRPAGNDDTEWTLVRRNGIYLSEPDRRRCCLTHRNGKIMICNGNKWRVESTKVTEVVYPYDPAWRSLPSESGKKFVSSYLVESRRELLWVIVSRAYYHRNIIDTIDNLASTLSVSVYALQEKEEGRELQWVKRHGSCLSDRVMFLGRPSSFAIDATQSGLSDGGGCAYFVDRSQVCGGVWSKSPLTRCRVFKYNFFDDKAELVEQLPEEWADEGCTWITRSHPNLPFLQLRKSEKGFSLHIKRLLRINHNSGFMWAICRARWIAINCESSSANMARSLMHESCTREELGVHEALGS